MKKNGFSGAIVLKRQEERISVAAFLAFLIVVCMPIHTLTIMGIGLLLLIGVPLFVLCSPTIMEDIKRKTWDKTTVLLALFFLYGLIAYVWTPVFSASSLYTFVKKVMVVVCLYSMPLNGREKKLLLNGSIVASLIVSWFLLTGDSIVITDERSLLAVFGVEQDPNYLGYLFLAPMAVSTNWYMYGGTWRKRIAGIVLAVLCLYSVLLTGSRGALLGIIAVVFVNFLGKFKTLFGKIIFCGVMMFLAMAVFNNLLFLLSEDLAMRFTIQDIVETGGTGRTDIWIATLQAMGKEPYKLIFGFGSSASIPVLGYATHNYILQLLLETGIVGTSLFLGFVWIWIKKLMRQDTMCLSIMVGCIAMFMTLSVNSIYYFWVAFMLSIVCSKAKVPMNPEACEL